MIAVCNATPLIHLAKIGRLDLLRKPFEQVHIPQAVFNEIVVQGGGWEDVSFIREAVSQGWLKVISVPISLSSLVLDLKILLGPGESEAIALACELRPDYLILDERAGRRKARNLGLTLTGTVGLLLNAKREGWLDVMKPTLDQLVRTGFRISDDLYRQALMEANET